MAAHRIGRLQSGPSAASPAEGGWHPVRDRYPHRRHEQRPPATLTTHAVRVFAERCDRDVLRAWTPRQAADAVAPLEIQVVVTRDQCGSWSHTSRIESTTINPKLPT